MSETGRRPDKTPKKDGEPPSLVCAICGRRYQPIQTPGKPPIYSICPDCRLDAGPSDPETKK